jgi:hypothetical protein
MSENVCTDVRSPLRMFGSEGANVGSSRDVSWLIWFFVGEGSPLGKPAKLGEHPDWEHGAFVTNIPAGQIQFLDARHRTQAHVEDRIKQFKDLRRP